MSPAELTASAAALQFVATAVVAGATIYYAKQANRQADFTERSLRIRQRREEAENVDRLRSLAETLARMREATLEYYGLSEDELADVLEELDEPANVYTWDDIYGAETLAKRIGGESEKQAVKACEQAKMVNYRLLPADRAKERGGRESVLGMAGLLGLWLDQAKQEIEQAQYLVVSELERSE